MNGELTSVLILCVYFAAFIQTDSELRYLADGVAVPVSEVRPCFHVNFIALQSPSYMS